MYCWHCGHKNPEGNKFCGECGKKQVRPADMEDGGFAETTPRITSGKQNETPKVATPPSVQPEANKQLFDQSLQKIHITNPLVDKAPPKRTGRTLARRNTDKISSISSSSTRSVPEPIPSDFGVHPSQVETSINFRPSNGAGAEETKVVSNPLVHESGPGAVRENMTAKKPMPPIAIKRPANRISGPSFLGLSNEPSSDSSYLLDDEDAAPPPSSSSWPGVMALTLLIVFGVLLVKQWSSIHDFATTYAQKAGLSHGDKSGATNDAVHHPPSAVSASGAEISASENRTEDSQKKNSGSNMQLASNQGDNSSAQSSDDLQKPESDNLESAHSGAKSPNANKPAYKPSDASDVSTHSSDGSEAKKSYDNSQIQLAEKYIYGRGLPQDCGRAMNLLQSAASQQNPNAQIKLGALYATGQCVVQDRAQAYVWYSKAKRLEPGNTWLDYSLNSLWASMSDEERRKAQSL